MTSLLLIPLVVQAALMLIDELYFHRKRGLPLWERVGHPIDTSSVLACYALALFSEPSPKLLVPYAALGVFSCLLITKDEFVHARHCRGTEHWIHATLFVLHPLVLAAVALLWFQRETTLLTIQAGLTLLFGCYQLLYWNVPWLRRSLAR